MDTRTWNRRDTLSDSRYTTDSNLQRLSDSRDFDVAENEPDIRGWDVILADGTTVGEVDDLLVDPAAMKVRFVDVELDAAALSLANGQHALVPIERADLHTDDKQVVLRGMDRDAVLHLQGVDVSRARGWHESTPAPARETAPAST